MMIGNIEYERLKLPKPQDIAVEIENCTFPNPIFLPDPHNLEAVRNLIAGAHFPEGS
jgi:hypothetical protein